MGKRTQKIEDISAEFDELELQVYEAFLARGWIIPQTEADVSRAEAQMAGKECEELPPSLCDPYELLRRSSETRAKVVSLQPAEDDETPELLARAARAGKDIPRDIEERMRQDRETAEKKSTNDQ
jgi:hypothetical protein